MNIIFKAYLSSFIFMHFHRMQIDGGKGLARLHLPYREDCYVRRLPPRVNIQLMDWWPLKNTL